MSTFVLLRQPVTILVIEDLTNLKRKTGTQAGTHTCGSFYFFQNFCCFMGNFFGNFIGNFVGNFFGNFLAKLFLFLPKIFVVHPLFNLWIIFLLNLYKETIGTIICQKIWVTSVGHCPVELIVKPANIVKEKSAS